jgi:hypothetical protein
MSVLTPFAIPRKYLKMGKIEVFSLVLLGMGLATGLLTSMLTTDFYVSFLAAEDGPLEWATAIFLLAGALVCLRRAMAVRRGARHATIMALGALILFFGAGEELSWGQRIFGWASGEFWQEHNAQNETNLHNLMVGDIKVNRLFFGAVLTLVFGLYFMLLPWLTRRKPAIRRLFDAWYVPVPRPVHGWAFAISLVVMGLVTAARASELGEFALGILLFLAVTYPANRDVLT